MGQRHRRDGTEWSVVGWVSAATLAACALVGAAWLASRPQPEPSPERPGRGSGTAGALGRTHEPAASLTWSGDSQVLAFSYDDSSQHVICATDRLGGGLRGVQADASAQWPTFRPSSSSLALAGVHDGVRGVWLTDTASGAWDLVAEMRDAEASCLAWSPDGSALAYLTRTANVEGVALHLATHDGDWRDRALRDLLPAPSEPRALQWTPHGRAVTFASVAAGTLLVGADGEATRGIDTVDPLAWMPDGRSLLYAGPSDDLGHAPLYRLGIADWSAEPLLAARSTRMRLPAASPDGDRIAFVETEDATGSPGQERVWLCVTSLSTGDVERLGEASAAVGPAWSPDGAMIAYSAPDGPAIWRVIGGRADGPSGQVAELCWSPDSTRLAAALARRGPGPPRLGQVVVLDASGHVVGHTPPLNATSAPESGRQ